MAALSAAQRTANVASSSGRRSAPTRLGGQTFVHVALPRSRRRRRGVLQTVRADLLPPTLFEDALSPIANIVPAVALDAVSGALTSAFSGLIGVAPPPLHPLIQLLGTDLVTLAQLQPSSNTVLRLAAIWYAFFSQPAPAIGLLDFYVIGPLVLLAERKWSVDDLSLRDRMGGGNFGQVFEGVTNQNGERNTSRTLTDAEKKRRVVLKRVNLDTVGVRTDFLRSGTVARGAAESGKVEQYICSRLARNPLARVSCAEYLGEFTAEGSEYGFTKGTQWLIWKYESDSTLFDALMGSVGPFPACLAPYVLGGGGPKDTEKRDAAVVKSIMRKVFKALRRMHRVGIVHRDIKPDNILVTNKGQVKVIDFGAAVDMCTGINFNPLSGMLDPRYSPPEELVMPEKTPRAPLPALAILFAPFTWLYGRPDLFDSYSAGILLLQLSVPELRSAGAVRNLNIELGNADYDLDRWRYGDGSPFGKPKAFDFTLLDRSSGSGWDLACKLTRKRGSFNRGRLSAGQALRHRYFLPFT